MLVIKDILQNEGTNTINRIGGNIFKAGITRQGINRTGTNISGSKTGANASGKTIQSMKVTATETELIITGREGFSMLETGISPQQSTATADKLYQWSKHKQIPFKNDKARFFAAKAWTANQKVEGSLLFRLGGRKDVFTNEVDPLVKAIENQIEKRFYEIKLVD